MKNMFGLFLSFFFFVSLAFPFETSAFTWKQTAFGTAQTFQSIYQSGTRLIATGNSGKVFYSDDAGITWTSIMNNSTVWYQDAGKFKTGELILIGQGGLSLSSQDNGKTWSQYSFGTTQDLYHISAKGDSGYLVGASGYLSYFANGVWNVYTTNTTEHLYAAFDLGDNKTAFIGGTSGLIWKTTLGGISWSVQTTGTLETIRGLYFSDVNKGFAVGTKGTFLKTTNGGSSWSPVLVSGLTDQTLYAIEGNGDVIVAVGDKIMLVSEDGGATWTSQSFATENYTFYDVTNNGGSNIWAVGTKDSVSSVAYQLDRSVPVVSTPTPSVPETQPKSEITQSSLVKLACALNATVNDPCRAVYYYATDGKRHAFPNDKVYFSWFMDFSTVKEVSVDFLASLTLGKNVTYRPGVKMVKFQTVPTVYAVAKGGVLRPISSEAVAASLYGSTWNKQIDDISDVFYGNYTIGASINSSADYDPAQARILVGSISDNF